MHAQAHTRLHKQRSSGSSHTKQLTGSLPGSALSRVFLHTLRCVVFPRAGTQPFCDQEDELSCCLQDSAPQKALSTSGCRVQAPRPGLTSHCSQPPCTHLVVPEPPRFLVACRTLPHPHKDNCCQLQEAHQHSLWVAGHTCFSLVTELCKGGTRPSLSRHPAAQARG